VKELGPNQVLTRFFINIDIHLENMPTSVMNWGMKNISAEIFNYIKKNSENLPETYVKRMAEDKEFYAYCQKKA